MSLCVLGADLEGRTVGVRCEDGLIAALGPDVTAEPDDEVLEAEGLLLSPPLVNGHTHAAMTLFRGYGDDLPLLEWLRTRIWPAEAKLEPEDVYWGTRLAAVEMIRSGTTRFVDMYWNGAEVARAAQDAGIRALVCAVLVDGLDPGRGEELRATATASLDRLGDFGPLITTGLGPHAIYTVSRDSLAWLAETAVDRDVPVHIHLSETEGEVSDCLDAHGVRPAKYLDELGLLGEGSILAHGVFLDDAELDLIAGRGSTIVANPAANMKLAVGGALRYPDAVERGVALGLGTDGPSSNSNLDMFEEMKVFALLQKHAAGDAAVASAAEVLELARGRRSPLLGGAALEAGAPADFLLLEAGAPELSAGDPDADLVYAANGSIVDTTVVAGRVLMRGREIEGADEAVAEVRERAARLTR